MPVPCTEATAMYVYDGRAVLTPLLDILAAMHDPCADSLQPLHEMSVCV